MTPTRNVRWNADAVKFRRNVYFPLRMATVSSTHEGRWRYWCLLPKDKFLPVKAETKRSVRAKRKCVRGQLSIIGCLTIPHRRAA